MSVDGDLGHLKNITERVGYNEMMPCSYSVGYGLLGLLHPSAVPHRFQDQGPRWEHRRSARESHIFLSHIQQGSGCVSVHFFGTQLLILWFLLECVILTNKQPAQS